MRVGVIEPQLFCHAKGCDPASHRFQRYAPAFRLPTQAKQFACSTHKKHLRCFVRVGVIETPSQPWEGRVLPLNHTRKISKYFQQFLSYTKTKTMSLNPSRKVQTNKIAT